MKNDTTSDNYTTNDVAMREFVQEYWHSVNPTQRFPRGQHNATADLEASLRDDETASSIMLSEYELGSVDTDALLSVVLDRSLLDFGFDYTCFASLDNKLLLSPQDAFAELCWTEATTAQLKRPKSQPQMKRGSASSDPSSSRRMGGKEEHVRRWKKSLDQHQLPSYYENSRHQNTVVPRCSSIDDYERDDWYDDDESDEDDLDDGRSSTPTPSLSYSDDSARDETDTFLQLQQYTFGATVDVESPRPPAVSSPITPSSASASPPLPTQLPPLSTVSSDPGPSTSTTTITTSPSSTSPSSPPGPKQRVPVKRVPVPAYTPSLGMTAVEAHYQVGAQSLLYVPPIARYAMNSPAGPASVPPMPAQGKAKAVKGRFGNFGILTPRGNVAQRDSIIQVW
ncbi:hypothetical protein BDV98DRAFT_557297 [Pterulicium gracile]|uniref:Uncharacterized protein n=1 Tax=Pterulicium gracile TaxID=1884261 RepID=A0A5C3QYN1_9AGAR|nr:hypothetical protein BDV98DRAFT_557297 [Pterula gracilis]